MLGHSFRQAQCLYGWDTITCFTIMIIISICDVSVMQMTCRVPAVIVNGYEDIHSSFKIYAKHSCDACSQVIRWRRFVLWSLQYFFFRCLQSSDPYDHSRCIPRAGNNPSASRRAKKVISPTPDADADATSRLKKSVFLRKMTFANEHVVHFFTFENAQSLIGSRCHLWRLPSRLIFLRNMRDASDKQYNACRLSSRSDPVHSLKDSSRCLSPCMSACFVGLILRCTNGFVTWILQRCQVTQAHLPYLAPSGFPHPLLRQDTHTYAAPGRFSSYSTRIITLLFWTCSSTRPACCSCTSNIYCKVTFRVILEGTFPAAP